MAYKHKYYKHNYVDIPNYLVKEVMDDTLSEHGDKGYKLVDTILLHNKYNVDILRMFFVKECSRYE